MLNFNNNFNIGNIAQTQANIYFTNNFNNSLFGKNFIPGLNFNIFGNHSQLEENLLIELIKNNINFNGGLNLNDLNLNQQENNYNKFNDQNSIGHVSQNSLGALSIDNISGLLMPFNQQVGDLIVDAYMKSLSQFSSSDLSSKFINKL